MKKIDVSLILPCYNEAAIFSSSVSSIITMMRQVKWRFEIIFVDDASTDKTVSFIKETCKKYAFCRSIFHKENTGRGKAVADGIRSARGRIVGYIDIDCEVSPVYIPEMVRHIAKNKADVVVGRRVYRTTLLSLHREIFSVGYRRLAEYLVGTKGIDTESGYKFFHRDKILPILFRADHPHWFWDTEVIVWAIQAGLRIKEIPVLFVRRFDKRSSVHPLRDIGDYIASLVRFRERLAHLDHK